MKNKYVAKMMATMIAASMTVSTAAVPVVMSVPVFAEDGATQVTKEKTISVTGVEERATVTAYQLVKGVYGTGVTEGKLVRYELTNLAEAVKYDTDKTVTLADFTTYSNTETGNTETLAKIAGAAANAVQSSSSTYTGISMTAGTDEATKTTYSANVEPGLYLVLVTKTDSAKVYNPVLLAVNVSDANNVADTATGSTVAIDTAFQNGSTTSYTKSSESGFEKKITNIKDNGADKGTGTKKGDALAIGDNASFMISAMTIPSYSDDYESVVYKITDTLEETGFTGIKNLTVKVGETEVAASSGDTKTYKITYKKGAEDVTDAAKATGFVIEFEDSYIRANGLKTVEVTYSSTLAITAGVNYAENFNHAELEYSNDPSDSTKTAKKTDNTYHYTFGIDASIDGESVGSDNKTNSWETHELNKVTSASGESSYEKTTTTFSQTTSSNTKKSKYALAGAEFSLYTDADCKTAAKAIVYSQSTTGDKTTYTKSEEMKDAVATSDENGHITFLGLDEGTYYLKETKAPSGYMLDDTVYKIVISATFGDNGVMTEYSIITYAPGTGDDYTDGYMKVGEAKYTNGEATVGKDGSVTNTVVTETQTSITPAEFVNNEIQSLPFTGGEGRYMIYLGSVALAGVVVVLGIAKKKSEKEA